MMININVLKENNINELNVNNIKNLHEYLLNDVSTKTYSDRTQEIYNIREELKRYSTKLNNNKISSIIKNINSLENSEINNKELYPYEEINNSALNNYLDGKKITDIHNFKNIKKNLKENKKKILKKFKKINHNELNSFLKSKENINNQNISFLKTKIRLENIIDDYEIDINKQIYNDFKRNFSYIINGRRYSALHQSLNNNEKTLNIEQTKKLFHKMLNTIKSYINDKEILLLLKIIMIQGFHNDILSIIIHFFNKYKNTKFSYKYNCNEKSIVTYDIDILNNNIIIKINSFYDIQIFETEDLITLETIYINTITYINFYQNIYTISLLFSSKNGNNKKEEYGEISKLYLQKIFPNINFISKNSIYNLIHTSINSKILIDFQYYKYYEKKLIHTKKTDENLNINNVNIEENIIKNIIEQIKILFKINPNNNFISVEKDKVLCEKFLCYNNYVIEQYFNINYIDSKNNELRQLGKIYVYTKLYIDNNEIIKNTSFFNIEKSTINPLEIIFLMTKIIFLKRQNSNIRNNIISILSNLLSISEYNNNNNYNYKSTLYKQSLSNLKRKSLNNLERKSLSNLKRNKPETINHNIDNNTYINYNKNDFLLINYNENNLQYNQDDCIKIIPKILIESPEIIVVCTQNCNNSTTSYQDILNKLLISINYQEIEPIENIPISFNNTTITKIYIKSDSTISIVSTKKILYKNYIDTCIIFIYNNKEYKINILNNSNSNSNNNSNQIIKILNKIKNMNDSPNIFCCSDTLIQKSFNIINKLLGNHTQNTTSTINKYIDTNNFIKYASILNSLSIQKDDPDGVEDVFINKPTILYIFNPKRLNIPPENFKTHNKPRKEGTESILLSLGFNFSNIEESESSQNYSL